jgi:phage-related protein
MRQQEVTEQVARNIQQAEQQVLEAQRGIMEARQRGNQEIADAVRDVQDAGTDLMRTQRDVAWDLDQRRRDMQESWRNIGKAQEEAALSIKAAEQQVAQSWQGIIDANIRGNELIADAQTRLNDAMIQAGRAGQQARDSINTALERQAEAQRDYDEAVSDAAQNLDDAAETLARANRQLAETQEEVNEAAGELGAILTSSQKALWDAIMGFYEDYKRAFGPAQETLTRLATDVVNFARQALPYLGRLANETAGEITQVWQELKADLRDPAILGPIKALLETAPENLGNALRAAKNIVLGILGILGELAPEAQKFWQWLADITAEFKEWATSETGRKQIRDFFERVWPVVRDVARAVWALITGLVKAGTSEPALRFFDHLAFFLEQVGLALPIIVQGLRPLNWLLNGLRTVLGWLDELFQPIIDAFREWTGIDLVSFTTALVGLVGGLVLFLGTIKLIRSGLGFFWGLLSSILGLIPGIGKRGTQSFGEFDRAKDKTKRNIQDFSTKSQGAFGRAAQAVRGFAASGMSLLRVRGAAIAAALGFAFLAAYITYFLGSVMSISTVLQNIQMMMQNFAVSLQTLGSNIMVFVQNLVTTVMNYIVQLPAMVMQYLGQLAQSAIQMTMTLAQSAITMITTLISQTIAYVTAAASQVISYITTIAAQVMTYLTQIATSAISFLQTLSAQTVSFLQSISAQVVNFLQGLAQPVFTFLQSLATQFVTFLQQVATQLPTFLQTLGTTVFTFLQNLATQTGTLLQNLTNTAVTTLQNVASQTISFLTPLAAQITGFIQTAGTGLFSAIGSIAASVGTAIQTAGSGLMTAVGAIFRGGLAVLSRAGSDFYSDISYVASGAWAVIRDAATSMWNEIDLVLMAIPGGILAKAPRVATAAIRFGRGFWEIASAAWGALFGEEGVTGAFDRLSSWVEGISWAGIWEWVGQSWVGGLMKGFSDWWSTKAWPQLKTWGQSVLDWINGFFGNRSPSRKFQWIGEMLSRGLAKGMRAGMSHVFKAAGEMTEAANVTPLLSVPIVDQASQQNLALQRQQLAQMQGQSSLLAARQNQEITVQLMLERRKLAEEVVSIVEERSRNQRRRGVR